MGAADECRLVVPDHELRHGQVDVAAHGPLTPFRPFGPPSPADGGRLVYPPTNGDNGRPRASSWALERESPPDSVAKNRRPMPVIGVGHAMVQSRLRDGRKRGHGGYRGGRGGVRAEWQEWRKMLPCLQRMAATGRGSRWQGGFRDLRHFRYPLRRFGLLIFVQRTPHLGGTSCAHGSQVP